MSIKHPSVFKIAHMISRNMFHASGAKSGTHIVIYDKIKAQIDNNFRPSGQEMSVMINDYLALCSKIFNQYENRYKHISDKVLETVEDVCKTVVLTMQYKTPSKNLCENFMHSTLRLLNLNYTCYSDAIMTSFNTYLEQNIKMFKLLSATCVDQILSCKCVFIHIKQQIAQLVGIKHTEKHVLSVLMHPYVLKLFTTNIYDATFFSQFMSYFAQQKLPQDSFSQTFCEIFTKYIPKDESAFKLCIDRFIMSITNMFEYFSMWNYTFTDNDIIKIVMSVTSSKYTMSSLYDFLKHFIESCVKYEIVITFKLICNIFKELHLHYSDSNKVMTLIMNNMTDRELTEDDVLYYYTHVNEIDFKHPRNTGFNIVGDYVAYKYKICNNGILIEKLIMLNKPITYSTHIKTILPNVICTETNMKYAMIHCNYVIVEIMLMNKFIPTERNIFDLFIYNSHSRIWDVLKIMNMMNMFGIHFTDKVLEMLCYATYSLTIKENEMHVIVPEYMRKRIKNICRISDAKYGFYSETDMMEKLRDMFYSSNYYALCDFMTQHNLTPDICCFENGIANKYHEVMMYIFDTCKYVPSLMAILQVKDMARRSMLMIVFYKEHSNIAYATNNCMPNKTINFVKPACKITKAKYISSSDSDNNRKPIKRYKSESESSLTDSDDVVLVKHRCPKNEIERVVHDNGDVSYYDSVSSVDSNNNVRLVYHNSVPRGTNSKKKHCISRKIIQDRGQDCVTYYDSLTDNDEKRNIYHHKKIVELNSSDSESEHIFRESPKPYMPNLKPKKTKATPPSSSESDSDHYKKKKPKAISSSSSESDSDHYKKKKPKATPPSSSESDSDHYKKKKPKAISSSSSESESEDNKKPQPKAKKTMPQPKAKNNKK